MLQTENILFFITLALYFLIMILYFSFLAAKKDRLAKAVAVL